MTDTAADVLKAVGGVVALGGFAFGLYQYYVAQKWKRSEFAAGLLEQLAADDQLAVCCKMLDWSTRTFAVPERYRVLAGHDTFQHDWRKLAVAMMPEEKKADFDWQGMLYRDLFDHFFDYLERIEHYISIRLVRLEDVRSLRYWLEQIAEPRFVEEPVFREFLEAYGYRGVFDLVRRFRITWPGDS